MNIPIEKFQQSFLRIKDHGTERSFYPALTNFLQELAELEKSKDIFATAEESAKAVAGGVGFPDVTVRRKDRLVGWVEVKLPEDSLDSPKFNKQFEKYKDALENILFTNFKQWQLWQWGDEGKPVKIKEIIFDVANFTTGEEQNLIDILHQFFSGKAYEARTTKQLALALAKKTKLLSNQVEEAFKDADETSDLVKLKETFEKTLIQNIEPHQFANMVAETVAYSLFLASLEHTKRGKSDVLTLTTAMDYLPASVPILADLYSLIKKVSQVIPNIHQATTALIDQLNAAEMAKIELKLREHKVGEDPVIHFYEPFLNEYDPKEREARGVYYTPKPVVDYIVRSVDFILKEKFGKEKGLADESVHLLDPATGTGTFLMSAIQQIHSAVQKQNNTLGPEMVTKEFNRVVVDHILKHFYGFELLVAPYAIAHLKLTLLLEDLGFDFEMAKGDGDKDRLKVYLANTLDDPNAYQKQAKATTDFGSIAFPSIAEESEAARKVKKDAPILAIIGNPPYSGVSANKGEWINKLIEDYKYIDGKHFGEKKHWLQDDYVKFIRFAQWKIADIGHGILSFITNHNFLDNPTFRGMRYNLLNYFDEIYILNLHGSSVKNEKAPDGTKDENVFPIQTGVVISFFIKNERKIAKNIFYSELFGLKENKFEFLLTHEVNNTEWTEIEPNAPHYIFKVVHHEDDYNQINSVKDVFDSCNTGIQSSRDQLVYGFERKDLLKKLDYFFNLNNSDDTIRVRFFSSGKRSGKYLKGDTRGWLLSEARKKKIDYNNEIIKIQFRAFDNRYLIYNKELLDWPRQDIMKHFLNKNNLGLTLHRNIQNQKNNHFFVTSLLCDMHNLDSAIGSYIFPLYLYSDSTQSNLFGKLNKKVNFSEKFTKECSQKLGISFISDGRGDLEKTFGPEDVFYYTYAIFHCPTYRIRYAEQLKIDFPRLPLTSNKELFKKLVAKGNELVNLHLLGENPFDQSKTIFDDSDKWGISLGGEKPESLEDWKVTEVKYSAKDRRVYVNPGQYFEGVEKEVWEFMIGGYQVCEKWLKDRKKAERSLSLDDLKHYMKIVASLRETIRIMKEIDQLISNWPLL